MERIIEPKAHINGDIKLEGDKSISHRAIMIGAIAKGETRVENVLDCDDCNFTKDAFSRMGIKIGASAGATIIKGKGLGGLKRPDNPLYLGSSGTSMRLLAGILAGQRFDVLLTGDAGLLKRPMRRIIEPLKSMGINIRAEDNEHPPIFIKGGRPLAIRYSMPIPSAQVKSAILFAGLYANGVTTVKERSQSRDHTERMLKFFGADIDVEGNTISVKGGRELTGRAFSIPADISSAAFFIVGAAMLRGSRITIRKVTINPTRAGVVLILKKMGVKIRITNKHDLFEPVGDIAVEASRTRGVTISSRLVPSIIDEIPIIAVLAAVSKGRTVINGIGELRVKETDRVESIISNLKRMGSDIRVEGDTMVIKGVERLKGAGLKSFGDHRTAMAMTIAAIAAEGQSVLDDDVCVSKSFPRFFETLNTLTV